MASFYVYDGPFDPANGAQNCAAGDNSVDNPGNEKIVTLNVQDEKTYRLVVFDDTFTQTGGSYQFSIEIPGGKAIDPANGAETKYVACRRSFSCNDLTATIKWKAKANKVKSAGLRGRAPHRGDLRRPEDPARQVDDVEEPARGYQEAHRHSPAQGWWREGRGRAEVHTLLT